MSLVHFQKKERLVCIQENDRWVKEISADLSRESVAFPFHDDWKAFYKRISDFYKETGADTACLVTHTIGWKYQNEWIKSPLYLIPLHTKWDRNSNQIIFSFDREATFLNPFIEKQFRENFDFQTSDFEEEAFTSKVALNPNVQTIEKTSLIGQFHYHRYAFLKEWEEITQGETSPLLRLFLDNEPTSPLPLHLTERNLTPVDPIQQHALLQSGKQSFVLQGPPGTGKSQVLLNILGKALLTNGLFACVSEKKSALDVLYKKLHQLDLGQFAVYLDDQTSLNSIYTQFKHTWNFLEAFSVEKVSTPSVTSTLKDKLQLLLNRLQTNDLSSGVSFWELKKQHESCPEELIPDTVHSIPLATLQRLKPQLESLKAIPFSLWSVFQSKFWKTQKWNAVIEWNQQWETHRHILPLQQFQDIDTVNQWCVLHQIQQSEHFDSFQRIVSYKTNWEKFKKIRRRFFRTQQAFLTEKEKMISWTFIPTEGQIRDWERLQSKFFGRKKVQKIIHRQLSEGISFETVKQLCRNYFLAQTNFDQCVMDLYEMNIFQPQQDFVAIDWFYRNFQQIKNSSWKSYFSLNIQQKQYIAENYYQLLEFSKGIPAVNYDNNGYIQEFITTFQTHLPLLKKEAQFLENLPDGFYYWMQRKSSFEEVEEQIICNEWHQFQLLFPTMANLNLNSIRSLIKEIIRSEQHDRNDFHNLLLNYRKQQFDAYQQLLLQTSSQLSAEEKMFKKTLKKGKSILVKEMNKSRQHVSLRQLWKTEAQHWLKVLVPIWMLTPSQLAKTFPMQADLFDISLVDEASQLPFTHTIGTLQRSKQIIIAGDSQQMAPSSFFRSEKGTDLLQLAQFQLSNYQLTYHYRSRHPELIRFSNHYFYHDKLHVFPFNEQKREAIQWIYVKNGCYSNRQNLIEAQEAALQIRRSLRDDKHIGIVAFSETQLQAIWKALDTESQEKISQKIEENTAFFKSLDKVQGDECDELIISLGYGKNETGDFYLHLGILLQKDEEKRLNVLFSRAKEKIIFISSVRAEDFPMSENPSIDLLKKYLQQLETPHAIGSQESKPDLRTWLDTLHNAEEILSLFSIYRERGWEL